MVLHVQHFKRVKQSRKAHVPLVNPGQRRICFRGAFGASLCWLCFTGANKYEGAEQAAIFWHVTLCCRHG